MSEFIERIGSEKKSKKGQVTIFIILAILIVVGIVIYFVLRNVYTDNISKNLVPVRDRYLQCIEASVTEGAQLMGEQAGYIETPNFVPGSNYRPFSSELDFLGQPVPYWMYVSGNNILAEQVPTKSDMERQLAQFVEERIGECDYSDLLQQGFDVLADEKVNVEISIKDSSIEVSVDGDLNIFYGDESVTVTKNEVSVESPLGHFYDLALNTYNYEKENMFLEAYALDVMRLYAPVTGTEISCSPKVFVESEIRQNIVEGLEANIPMIKLDGNYYDLSSKENDYFVVDSGENVDVSVNMIYSPEWPTRVEIYGDMVARPVGLQEGLGALGFCYVPYHFIYDIDFPVLVQFYDSSGFVFQFPVAVVIEKSNPRNALPSVAGTSLESEVCKYKNQEVDIYTYDSDLNPVEALVSFRCLDSDCDIGETKLDGNDAFLRAGVPQCVNGFFVARAEGYVDSKHKISTNEETSADIILRRLYNVSLDLGNVDSAIVTFDGEGYSATALYPSMKSVQLVEGFYNVSVSAFDNSSLTIPSTSRKECVDVPKEGFGGLLGMTDEKCFTIDMPETKVDFAIVGGGKSEEYLAESSLRDSRELNINVPLFGVPSSLEGLQENYAKAEAEKIYLEFE